MSLTARFVAVVTLLMQVSAPLAAYVVAAPGPGLDDFCSVAKPTERAPFKAPGSAPVDRHALSHCALCAGGSATAALPAPSAATFVVIRASSERIADPLPIAAVQSPIRPHARGPPRLA